MTADVVNEEPVNMTVSRLKRLLEQYDDDMLVFPKSDAGVYSTIIFEVSEEGGLELQVL